MHSCLAGAKVAGGAAGRVLAAASTDARTHRACHGREMAGHDAASSVFSSTLAKAGFDAAFSRGHS
jgi:hypothetical protein